jgi:GNAT superfamily N-acetyltransferase
MRIREAGESDAQALAALVAGLGYPVTEDEMRSRLRALTGPLHGTFVAEMDGKTAGFIGLCALPIYQSSTPFGYILALSVSETFRRRGVGRALLRQAEAWFGGRQIVEIRVSTGKQRNDAHLFYERCGFQNTGYRFARRVAPAEAA